MHAPERVHQPEGVHTLINFMKHSVCMRSNAAARESRQRDCPGGLALPALAAAPVLFVHAVVTVATNKQSFSTPRYQQASQQQQLVG